MKIVAQGGSKLAIPSQTTYLESERGLDEELKHASESPGRERRKKTSNGESQT